MCRELGYFDNTIELLHESDIQSQSNIHNSLDPEPRFFILF